MKKKSIFKMMALSLLFGSISLGFVACNSDDDDGGVIDKSPAQVIDLGLPSGTLWASCNVGTTKPEEYGDYYAWGEIIPKYDFRCETYKWCNESQNRLTKYCHMSYFGNDGFQDNKTELDVEDDAAYMNWGGSWRMPSFIQIKELINNCSWEWIKLNGVCGFKGTSRNNGNIIFLPATGYRSSTSNDHVGTAGLYWSRTSDPEDFPEEAYNIDFYSGHMDWNDICDRCYGLSVRPVRMK